ncbi:hypothetical protein [Nonomuraea recticatena]|uniref:Uncharacterized protein n=1 Tax=Nonomuraea recticatena TaxID=46178 RepID=A0ABP6FJJ5_9ACTN
MNVTLSREIQETVARTKAAHQTVKAARKRHEKAVQKRNLGALVLVMRHDRKVLPTMRLAALGRAQWQEILPEASIPSTLPKWSPEQAEKVIAEAVSEIAAIGVEEQQARENRVRGVLKLSQTTIDGNKLNNVEVGELTELGKVMVGKDLKHAKEWGFTEPDAGTASESAGMVPLAVMAERLGVSTKRVLDRIEYARENGIEVPRMSLAANRVQLVDEEAFPAWWVENRFHWLAAKDLAERWGVPYEAVKERLRTAKAKGTDPESANFGRRIFYEPASADEWGAQYGYAPRQ